MRKGDGRARGSRGRKKGAAQRQGLHACVDACARERESEGGEDEGGTQGADILRRNPGHAKSVAAAPSHAQRRRCSAFTFWHERLHRGACTLPRTRAPARARARRHTHSHARTHARTYERTSERRNAQERTHARKCSVCRTGLEAAICCGVGTLPAAISGSLAR
eukprot:1528693-Pleurochrysis_carterae.AAC.2